MAKYGKKAQETVEDAMKKFKKGELKSGKSGKTVKSREQAIVIGLSEAREKGAKVPPPVSKKSMKGSGLAKTQEKRAEEMRLF